MTLDTRRLLALALCSVLIGCSSDDHRDARSPQSDTPTPTPTAAVAVTPHPIVGRWTGQWYSSDDYNGHGSLTVSVTQDGENVAADGTITWVPSEALPELSYSGEAIGMIDESGTVHFSFQNIFGSGSGEVTGPVISGSGRVKAPLLSTVYKRGKGFTFVGQLEGFTTNYYRAYGSFSIAKTHFGHLDLWRQY